MAENPQPWYLDPFLDDESQKPILEGADQAKTSPNTIIGPQVVSENGHQSSSSEDQSLSEDMPKVKLDWSRSELNILFRSISKHRSLDVVDISRLLGTKTAFEVSSFLGEHASIADY